MNDDNISEKSIVEQHKTTKSQFEMEIDRAFQVATQYHNSGNLAQAQSIYQQILKVLPNHAEAMHLSGVIAYQSGKNDIAEKLIIKAIRIKPDMDEAYNNLGTLLEGVGRFEESLIQYQKSLEINSRNATVYFNLANVFRVLGHLDKAMVNYKKAIELQPDFAAAHTKMAGIKKHISYDSEMKAMEQLYASSSTNDEQRMTLAFGLGKAFEDLKQYPKAFEFIQQGNKIKRSSFKFQINQWDKHLTSLKSTFNKDFFEKNTEVGCQNKGPLFILGMPRSGTSLTEQILSSHSNVIGLGEVHVLDQTISSVFKMDNLMAELIKIEPSVFTQLGEQYINAIRALAIARDSNAEKSGKANFVTDKMPGNFKLIGLIKLILPNAKIIHCRRDPMDNCFSLFKNSFNRGHVYAYDQVELGKYYRIYSKLMKHWHQVLPGFIYDVQYEELVSDQLGQTRALLDFCGLDWEEACINFHQSQRAVKTVSAAQVRRPIYKDSILLWKNYQEQLAPLYKSLRHD